LMNSWVWLFWSMSFSRSCLNFDNARMRVTEARLYPSISFARSSSRRDSSLAFSSACALVATRAKAVCSNACAHASKCCSRSSFAWSKDAREGTDREGSAIPVRLLPLQGLEPSLHPLATSSSWNSEYELCRMLLLITMCRAEATIRIRPAAKAVAAMQATIGEPLVNVDKNASTSMTRALSFDPRLLQLGEGLFAFRLYVLATSDYMRYM
jgi:hypothetical protein